MVHLLYAWGKNKSGELGLGFEKNTNDPKTIQGF